MSDKVAECYHNKFHPTEPQCPLPGLYRREPLGNMTDEWTWCALHCSDKLDPVIDPNSAAYGDV